MNVNYEKIDNVNARLSISFVEDDYKDEVKKSLNELGRTRPLKGFRPGHVPFGMLKKFYGNQVTAQVVDRMVSRELRKYIVDNKLAVLGEPLLDKDTQVDIEHSTEFEFKFDLGLQPEFDLTIDKSITIPYYNIQVSQEMLDNENESLRKRYGKQVPGDEVTADALLRGSLTELDAEGNDKPEGIVVERTVLSPQYLKADDEKAKFIGATVGDGVVYNPLKAVDGNITEMASLLNVDKANANVDSDFRFTIKEILVNADAEMDQEFFDAVLGSGVATDEGTYFEKLRERLSQQLVGESNYRFTIDSRKVLSDKVGDMELPDEFMKRYLLENGKEDYTAEQIEKEYATSRGELVWQLIVNKVMKQFDIKVEEDDVMAMARVTAARQFAQYGMTNLPDDMIENYARKIFDDEKYRNNLISGVEQDKVFGAIRANVTVDEKSVSTDEFNALFKTEEPENVENA